MGLDSDPDSPKAWIRIRIHQKPIPSGTGTRNLFSALVPLLKTKKG